LEVGLAVHDGAQFAVQSDIALAEHESVEPQFRELAVGPLPMIKVKYMFRSSAGPTRPDRACPGH
jgi:hypothetical protein